MKICYKLKVLRKPLPSDLFKEDRQKKEKELLKDKMYLIQFTLETGKRYLYEGKQETLAKATAMQCLHFSESVYGPDSLQTLPAYLLMAEACIGLGKLSQAEEHLALASWKMLKTGEGTAMMKSTLHRSYGILYAASGKTQEALRELAEAIYQASMAYGTDDIHTTGGYFHMAEIFFRMGKRLVADSIYRQLTQSWYKHLMHILKYRFRPSLIPKGVGPGAIFDDVPVVPDLEEIQKSEARFLLTAVHGLRVKQARCPPGEMQMICLTLAIFQLLYGSMQKAVEMGRRASSLNQYNPESELSQNAEHFLTLCGTIQK